MSVFYVTNQQKNQEDILKAINSANYNSIYNAEYLKNSNISFGYLNDVHQNSSSQFFVFNNFTILFVGKVYNIFDIKHELELKGHYFEKETDSEIIVKGFSEWDTNVFSKLNGDFSFVIYDEYSDKITCVRDRLGVKPLYFCWKNGDFEICSLLRPLIDSQSKICNDALSFYMDCGYVPSPFSIIEDIHKLSSGKYLEIDLKSKDIKILEYWNLKKVEQTKIPYKQAKEQLHSLLKDAVKIRMTDNQAWSLSGGTDSALITSIASTLTERAINTFTIAKELKYDESIIAAKYAEILKTNHTKTVCSASDVLQMLPYFIKVYDEPFADSSALPSLLNNSIIKQHSNFVMSGDGGDECFLGYSYLDRIKKFLLLKVIPYKLRLLISKLPLHRLLRKDTSSFKNILSIKNVNEWILCIFIGYDTLQKNRNTKFIEYYDNFSTFSANPFQKAADLNIKLWLENDSNVKVDRAGMAFDMKVSSPFLDYRIVEFARNLPVDYRYRKNEKKYILRDILSEYIPKEVFNQPKRGFTIPISKWIREDLKEQILLELNDDFFQKLNNFDVAKFKKQLNEHLSGKFDYSVNIWRIFILAKWYKEFKF
ncbi:MAG: asparagine synthase (glutamine-hydrolyzing) [Tannerella sp.]|jgi:asparagine synthase (glutamine-hydrolysing)|nr:asparagine synthase (glutamine-hydrolyzing) [Tannerella sp.]